MMDKKNLTEWLTLTKIKGFGPKKIMALLKIFSNVDNIFQASDQDLLDTRLFNNESLKELRFKKSFDELINLCKLNNIEIVPLVSEIYPEKLKQISDPPLTLYSKGNLKLLFNKKIAIVGSRESSENAKTWALNKAKDLTKQDYVVVSGGAKGLDIEAHKGALLGNGKTICVLGSGILNPYPKEHSEIFNEIAKVGLLLSEHPPYESLKSFNLVRRNRITSGISEKIVVVTSSESGGTFEQIKIASKQKIPILCSPLSLGFSPNKGINLAIKNFNAIETEDITKNSMRDK